MRAAQRAAFAVENDEIFRFKLAFAKASRSGQDAAGIQANRQVAFAGGDKAVVVEPATDCTDIAAVFRLGLVVTFRDRILTKMLDSCSPSRWPQRV